MQPVPTCRRFGGLGATDGRILIGGEAMPSRAVRALWRRLGRSRVAMWPVIELSMTVGVQILLTPLLLHRLGPQQFGVWVLVQSALLASAALSLGAGAGMMPVVSVALRRGDGAAAGVAMRWFLRRVTLASLLALLCLAIAIASGFMPGAVSRSAQRELWPLALASLLWMTATELDNAAASALKAHDRFRVAAETETAARLAQLGLTAVLVDVGSTALVPILVGLAVTVAKLLVRLVVLQRFVMQRPAAADAGAVRTVERELAVTGAWIWAGALGSLAFYSFDRWLVGAWFGTSTLAAYAICTQLAQLPHAIVSAACQPLVPWVARRIGPGTPGSEHRAALRVLAGATALSALPALLLLPLLQPLLGLWISERFAAEHLSLARGLTGAFLLLSLNAPGFFFLLGMGQARLSTIVMSACGVIFVLGALLAPRQLATFVVLKGVFAALALGLPILCALRLRTAASSSRT